jgi:RES domain-containing protein
MRNVIIVVVIASGLMTAGAQQSAKPAESHHMAADMPKVKMMTTAEKIANAMSSAPREIAGKATILDWPANEGSNTDPYAMKQTMDNQWGHHKPHMMIVVPDVKALDGMSTHPNNGGPYVMYAGTPYAHIMAPISSGGMK